MKILRTQRVIVRGSALFAMLVSSLALAAPAAARPHDASPDGQCVAEAAQLGLIGRDLNPSNATFVGGTAAADTFWYPDASDTTYVICGFGGNDQMIVLSAGYIFIGGAGNDEVWEPRGGTFYQ